MRFAAALLLLLFMAVDLTSICNCEDDSFEAGGSGPVQVSLSTTPGHVSDNDFSHECFCCCRHIQTERIVHVFVQLPLVDMVQEMPPHSLTIPLSPFYHPPRVAAA